MQPDFKYLEIRNKKIVMIDSLEDEFGKTLLSFSKDIKSIESLNKTSCTYHQDDLTFPATVTFTPRSDLIIDYENGPKIFPFVYQPRNIQGQITL